MKIIQDLNTLRTTNTCEPVAQVSPDGFIPPALIKKKELCKRLSVSTRTVDSWVAKRLIPYIQVSPRFYLYDFDAVLAALRKQYQVEPVCRV